ncbi:hypothetical protein LEP1GSC070_0502 [Leptospira santarosai str. AIM]|nr:hypothetical protein LEP1GSC070_0502 [Leptospira santarosai str. AIM]
MVRVFGTSSDVDIKAIICTQVQGIYYADERYSSGGINF